MERNPKHTIKVVLSFAAIYVVWGSANLANHIAIDTLPPFSLAAFRFLVSGAILFALALASGVPLPREKRAYFDCALVGILFFLLGNGVGVWSLQHVPTGIAAMFGSTIPLWMAAIEWLWKGGERMGKLGVWGSALALSGVFFLLWPELQQSNSVSTGSSLRLFAEFVIVSVSVVFAFGSVYGKHAKMPDSPVLSASLQMLFGGAGLVVASLMLGEMDGFDLGKVSRDSFLALGYLILFGSCLGFTAYNWLLRNVPAEKVATFAYVNPVIAVVLGWVFLGEILQPIEWVGVGVVVAGVVLISKDRVRKKEGSSGP